MFTNLAIVWGPVYGVYQLSVGNFEIDTMISSTFHHKCKGNPEYPEGS